MQLNGLTPKIFAYSATHSACEQDKQPHKAIELRAEVQQIGLAPNAITYSTAISACEKAMQPV